MDRDLISRLAEMKQPAADLEDFKKEVVGYIQTAQNFDAKSATNEIYAALFPMLNSQNSISEERKTAILNALRDTTDDITRKVRDSVDEQRKSLAALTDVLKGLSKEVNSIDVPKVDLSSVEKSIKNIKPTSTKGIEDKLNKLIGIVASMAKQEVKPVDLKPVLDAINKPRTKTVTFEVIEDEWEMPKQVIATEVDK
jgi:dGTP triphosphohydrolase